jgi:hypothetical protein
MNYIKASCFHSFMIEDNHELDALCDYINNDEEFDEED